MLYDDFIRNSYLWNMVTISKKNRNIIVSFPQDYIQQSYVEKFLDFLKFAEIAEKSKMTKAQAYKLAEEVRLSAWNEAGEKYLKRVKK